jgi:hypothetical protein
MKATRLLGCTEQMTLKNTLRSALAVLWKIDGQPGLWSVVQGCQQATTPPVGCAVAQTLPTESWAIFRRERDLELVVCGALGLTPPA